MVHSTIASVNSRLTPTHGVGSVMSNQLPSVSVLDSCGATDTLHAASSTQS